MNNQHSYLKLPHQMSAQETIKIFFALQLESAEENTMFWLILKVIDQSINKSQVVIHR